MTYPDPPAEEMRICKHCVLLIKETPWGWVHAEGVQQSKHNCGVNPYGFHAEPVGTPCGDHPANPCNGARGYEVQK